MPMVMSEKERTRNAKAQKAHRERKAAYIQKLEEEVRELTDKNARLEDEIRYLKAQQGAEASTPPSEGLRSPSLPSPPPSISDQGLFNPEEVSASLLAVYTIAFAILFKILFLQEDGRSTSFPSLPFDAVFEDPLKPTSTIASSSLATYAGLPFTLADPSPLPLSASVFSFRCHTGPIRRTYDPSLIKCLFPPSCISCLA